MALETVRSRARPVRVLYSFPHKIGAGRICYTAWQQVNGLTAAGAEVVAFPGAVQRPLPTSVSVRPTLARGSWRLPYRLFGTLRTLALHDYVTARRLNALVGQIDVVHVWPVAALQTLKVARRCGIPTVLERPNTHTRYAYESVQQEAKRLGIVLPRGNEYAFNADVLRREEEEYRAADYILCPSDFVARTFLDRGFPGSKLKRHQYGYDDKTYFPDPAADAKQSDGMTMLFCGDAAVRKGLHFALEAWLRSDASRAGTFLIAGRLLPSYASRLSTMLSHPNVCVLGHRSDVPDLMRQSDVLVLPSIEEGSPLVCAEAIGSGCVPLVSEVCVGMCRHMVNALIHPIGAVATLTEHLTTLHHNRALLRSLRAGCLATRDECTWKAAGVRLLSVYEEITGDDVTAEPQLFRERS